LEYGSVDQNGRQITIGPKSTDSLQVSRRIFVPASGGYARYFEVLTNNSSTAITLPVSVFTYLNSNTNMQLVSDPATNGNTFGVTEDSTGSTPIVAFVFANAGALVSAVNPVFASGSGFVSYSWNVTVPAGQTVALMHFVAQHAGSDLAGAQSLVQQLLTVSDPNELTGLTPTDLSNLVNFKTQ
jgi:hypothetical protein